jgi:ComF family protein
MAILYFMAVKITSIIEKMVAITAPHRCISCGIDDNILCPGCSISHIVSSNPFCAICAQPCANWRLCPTCRQHSGLEYVWVAADYTDLIKAVIHKYKFERARAGYVPLARLLAASLPYGDWQIAPIPTADSRVRQRGYDHARLLAEELAGARQLPLLLPLRRTGNSRQVGASRTARLAQAQQVFTLSGVGVKGATIVLVDDVCTTGATLSAAAKVLKRAGAKKVHAVVCAWQAPKANIDASLA